MKYLLISVVFFLLGSLVTFWVRERYTISISPKQSATQKAADNIASTPAAPSVDWERLRRQVLPDEGFRLSVAFGDLGPKLLESGAIDLKKFESNFSGDGGLTDEQKTILTEENEIPISINEKNATFMVDFFWALGLANKNRILDEGPMAKDRDQLGNYASTGGWGLGKAPSTELFSNFELIKLTESQQKTVEEVVAGVFRPCCGNATSYPDCNHGMAALGLAQYLASKGFTKEEIFNALLKFNSFWFPQNYLDLAAYFKLMGNDWPQVSSQLVLGSNYSSGQGYTKIKRELDAKMGVQPPVGGASGRGCST